MINVTLVQESYIVIVDDREIASEPIRVTKYNSWIMFSNGSRTNVIFVNRAIGYWILDCFEDSIGTDVVYDRITNDDFKLSFSNRDIVSWCISQVIENRKVS